MAKCSERTSARDAMWISFTVCLDNCCISDCGAYNMGMLVNHYPGARFGWIGCHNGWHCPSFSILLNHALVENPVAKFK